jgi:[acyl-carrier-protein] S-malonyltransferase
MLPVSAAFHTSLMRPVADALTPLLDAAHLTDPDVPIMANVDGQPLAIAADLRDELIRHIFSPVQWVRAVETMRDAGITDYLEIGPGNILSGLIKRTQKDAQTQTSDTLLASA